MGNTLDCFRRCFGKTDRRSYIRSRYMINNDFGIEFENLMDDGDNNDDERRRLLTDEEKRLLSERQFDKLVQEQKKIDAQIDNQLAAQEEEVRLEEESYYEAKREAARLANIQRLKQAEQKRKQEAEIRKQKQPKNKRAEVPDDEWDLASGEDDFESFLESVRARSVSPKRDDVKESQSTIKPKEQANADTSGTLRQEVSKLLDLTHNNQEGTKARLLTASSTDLEHEQGVNPSKHKKDKPLADSNSKVSTDYDDPFQWDEDDELLEFVGADETKS